MSLGNFIRNGLLRPAPHSVFRTTGIKLAISFLILGVYSLLFYFSRDVLGSGPSLLASFAVFFIGWIWGAAGGILGAVLIGFLVVVIDTWLPPFGETSFLNPEWTLRVFLLSVLGLLAGLVGVSQDRIRQSEEKFKVLAEDSPNMIFINKGGKVVYANPQCEKAMGYKLKEFYHPKFDFMALIAPEYQKKARENFKKHLAGQDVPPAEYVLLTKDGRRIFARHDTKLIEYEGGRAILGVVTDLTESHRIEEALRDSEERFRTLVDASPDSVAQTDLKGDLISVSGRTLELHGYTDPAELLGKSAFVLIAPEDHPRARRNLEKTLREGKIMREEYVMLRKDGSTFIGELDAALVKDEAGRPRSFIATVRDITGRREAERKIRISEDRYRLVTDQTGQLIYDWDVASGQIVWSGAIREITGDSPKEFQKVDILGWGERIHPEDRPAAIKLLESARETGGRYVTEYRFRRKDGNYIYVSDHGAFLKDEEGRSYRMVGVMSNVSEKVEYEQELQKFRIAMENAHDYIVLADPDGIILYANPAIERITGFSPKEVLGKKAGTKELWGGMMGKPFYQKLWKTIKTDKKVFAGEVKNKRKDGTRYDAFHTITPILDDDGKLRFFLEVQRDITQEKEVDQAKTEFVSLASHQLRTPLTAINWYSEMLLSGDVGQVSEEQSRYLKEVYKGSQRMVRLVNDLLNVSRLETGGIIVEPVPTEVIPLVNDIIKESRFVETEHNVPVKLSSYWKKIKLKIDSDLLRQVLRNLVGNAIRYCANQPNPEVRLKLEPKPVGKVDSLLISIADNGIGIAKEDRHRVFEKFFRGSAAGRVAAVGTGLGLYIAKMLVERWGGKIWFESEENKGTVFYVTIPMTGMVSRKGEKKLA